MDNVYLLNTHPLSGTPMPKQEHQHLMTVFLVVMLLVAIAAGAWYWISMLQTPAPAKSVADQQATIRAEVEALLESEPVHASQADINTVASLLVKSRSKTNEDDQQAMARELVQ